MEFKLRRLALLVALLIIATAYPCMAQVGSEGGKFLIELTLTDSDYKKLHKPRTVDLDFDAPEIIVNGLTVDIESLRTRGKTSLRQYRKSFTVELEDIVFIEFDSGVVELKDFYLISMSLDRHYYYNRFSFDCMKAIGIFPLRYRYVEVKVNGSSEGVYLLVERPFDHLLDVMGSPYALRRIRTGEIDREKEGKDIPDAQINSYRQRYLGLLPEASSRSGERAFSILNEAIDMRAYMKWLSFNYLVRNGDYTDEVYFFIEPGSEPGRFDILPWDYDDIFMTEPHEGSEQKQRVLGHKLLFSSEDPMDRLIGTDKYLYNKYLDELERLMLVLDDETMRSTLDNIKEDLIPYLRDENIVEALKVDHYGGSDAETMSAHMDKIAEYLGQRRNMILTRVTVARTGR